MNEKEESVLVSNAEWREQKTESSSSDVVRKITVVREGDLLGSQQNIT